MIRVAYLGPKGTFSEEAAHQYFANNTTWVMYESILDVLEAVHNGEVDKCIVPIENSIAGNIHMTVDGLLMYDLRIEADLIFKVSLHLIGNQDSSINTINTVYSISPAINQCREFIKKHQYKCDYTDSTAKAAQFVKESNLNHIAAIASRSVADEHGLQILESEIQDNSMNHTRFIIVGKDIKKPAEQKKTMILINPNNEYPGVLSSILNVFSALGINLTWIESRPTGKKLGTYRFLIESEAAQNDLRMIKAVKILETFEHEVQIVGSYSTTVL
ncbi:prephenate dehydratase/chorismate mutase/prephenate dehydratase [Paenibacillus cellulosilyticus]|uniref:Prephenate dehydratase n=1 Tax=Paenibacillus cellulosilyticus TaxID=375489 RepID=A0A2V2YUU7_9BACL|nr:prephenate dehydratase [Paenibacillus cellulosilyticus]PWW02792.1 prephenate dehydratase/chorismate mutase/prephenate dehydratase [Paenibacillus cellulosilyticus]QKS45715.1 prephenate dehydratase [Paenibacillus cellulosilyticus]